MDQWSLTPIDVCSWRTHGSMECAPIDPIGQGAQGTAVAVNTRGPASVTATVCSKCADREPSCVTIVHLSCSVRVADFPTFTIGSMAIVRPDSNFGPLFGVP